MNLNQSKPEADVYALFLEHRVAKSALRLLRTPASTLVAFIAAVSVLLIAASQATYSTEFDEFRNGCVNGCVKSPDHQQICDRQCDCIVSILRKNGGNKPLSQMKLQKSEIQKLNFICIGDVGVALLIETCNRDCNSDQACLQACDCISKKIRKNRTPEEIGEFFNSLATNTAAMNQLQTACARP